MFTRFIKSIAAYFVFIGAMTKVFFHLIYGIWKVAKLKQPPITIFGGSRLHYSSIYMQHASHLAQKLAKNGIPVLTGGGPGIMEAATCGASAKNPTVITTIGISVHGLELGPNNPKCHRHVVEMDNFGSRKWLLIHYSKAFVVFPGGFGTLNELTELLTLFQTKLNPSTLIVLIGRSYWQPFLDWMNNSALTHGLIGKEDVDLLTVTDDVDEAFELIKKAYHSSDATPQQDISQKGDIKK